jgi:PAS domain S-box-containing protein
MVVKNINDMRLRTKFLLAYLGLTIILFTCGGMIALHLVKRAVKSNIESNLSNGTYAIINLVETSALGSIKNYLRAVAEKNLEIAKTIHQRHLDGEYTELESRKKIREILLSQTIGNTGYIYCINSQGVATVHPKTGVEGNNWSQFGFIHKQVELKTGYIEYQWKNPGEFAERHKALYMTYFEPYDWIISVSTYRDEFKELLPMEEVRQSVKALKFGASGYVFVADSQGNILIHPELEGENLFELGERDTLFFERMVQEGFGQVIYWWQNPGDARAREKLALYGYIPGFDWIVGSTGYVDEIYSSIKSAQRNTFVFILAALLLSAILTVFISDSITRRLNHLMTVITQGDHGDLTVRADPGPDDEIGRLSLLYNSFLERLQSYHEKLEAEIEKHRATAESLQKSKSLFQAVFNQTFQFIGILTPEGTTRKINQTALDFAGVKEAELIGKKFWEGPAWRHSELTQNKVKHAIKRAANAEFTRMEVSHASPDNQIHIIDFSLKPVTDATGEVQLLIAEGRDITDRKLAEEALKENEEKYRTLFDMESDALAMIEIDTGKILEVNQSFIELYGYSREEILRMKNTDFSAEPEETREATQARDNYIPVRYHKKKDGTVFPTEISSSVFSYQGQDVHIAAIRDITERKRLEAQIQRSQKMESLGLLAGGVAHDLNNILSGIVSYPELILLDLPKGSELRRPIETMQAAGNRAAAIVEDLLTIARGVATTKEILNINTLVSDYLKSPEFQKLIQFHSTVAVQTDFDSNLLNIKGSYSHIRKVIMNLVSNASEAIEGSGTVTLSTRNSYVDQPLKGYDDVNIGEYVVFTVSDNGKGIPVDDIDRIFEPFFTKKIMGRSGTGLGLAVVWNVMQDHNGYIDIESNENGTTFRLYFPISRKELIENATSIPIESYMGHGETILVVDDIASQREIACKILGKLGYDAKEVSSGEEAVDYVKNHTVDLLLLDMIMEPGISGLETYDQILKIHPGQKAVIVSGFSETDAVKEAQLLGAGQFVKKPYTLEKIGIAIQQELQQTETKATPHGSQNR